jgi:hypothetical protein
VLELYPIATLPSGSVRLWIMATRRESDLEHKSRFYEEHQELFAQCEAAKDPLSPHGKKLILLAREHFGYSPTTAHADIWRSLMRHYRLAWKRR